MVRAYRDWNRARDGIGIRNVQGLIVCLKIGLLYPAKSGLSCKSKRLAGSQATTGQPEPERI
jgi:hypothetical protein